MSTKALPAPDIPQDVDELTPAWLTEALRAGGFLGGARVVATESEILGEGEGFVGQIVRLRLSFDGPAPEAPRSVIAKMPIRLEQNRNLGEAVGAYEREIRFYTELADRVPIAKPACFYAAMDPNPQAGREQQILDFLERLPRWLVRFLVPLGFWLASKSRRRYLLLLEDLAPSRRLGDQVGGCTREEAASALRHVAAVHLAWWEHPDLATFGWAPPVNILSRYAEVLYRKSWKRLDGLGADLSSTFWEFADWLREGGTPVMQRLGEPPFTLLHGDYRLDNMFFEGEGADTRLTVFDWQMVSRGPAALDVAYFISGNLTEDVAEECADDLLREYHQLLCDGGVSGYDFDTFVRDYRTALLYIAYRILAGADMMDFSSERGTALIRSWLLRIDTLLGDDFRELAACAAEGRAS